MGSFQVIGIPVMRPSELRIGGTRASSATLVSLSATLSRVTAELDRIRYSLPWPTHDAKSLPNLMRPTFTSCLDGDVNTYNESSTSSSTWVDDLVKVDIGSTAKIVIVAARVLLLYPGTAPAHDAFRILGSPDDVTYTQLAVVSVPSNVTSYEAYPVVSAAGYRYFKTQIKTLYSSVPVTVRLFEFAIWEV
jgi:hypothetical protein